MAHLPPKFPETWPQHLPIPPPTSSFTHHPSWLDEFFDFSSSKRGGAHRRSMSDSIAFFDSGPPPSSSSSSFFDRLDDSQLFSMFSDHPPPSSSAPPSTSPSTPSDNNSINDHDLKPIPLPPSPNDQSEAQSADTSAPPAASAHRPLADPRRVKRILANRQSAQRSRVRKLQYISELERSVNALQTEVSALSPRVAFFDHQRSILTVGNSHLRHRIAALAQDNIFKDAHQEALKKEIERLTNVYHQQNLRKLDGAPAADIKELPSNT